jgi:hypothetical protein
VAMSGMDHNGSPIPYPSGRSKAMRFQPMGDVHTSTPGVSETRFPWRGAHCQRVICPVPCQSEAVNVTAPAPNSVSFCFQKKFKNLKNLKI